MPYKRCLLRVKSFALILSVLSLSLLPVVLNATGWRLPELPPPSEYGNVLIDRTSTANEVKPVLFPHWLHRTKYTCRVCHYELEFEMTKNTTAITEEANKEGRYCGRCHNGKVAFDHSEKNCDRCHTGRLSTEELEKKFKELLSQLPKAPFGNRINWVEALNSGKIQPKLSVLQEDFTPIPFYKDFELETWSMIPPAFFPHSKHIQWLDCAQCHPDIFNIKRRTTKHFNMSNILQGKFCGACHLQVAFPMHNCKKCHPSMRYNIAF